MFGRGKDSYRAPACDGGHGGGACGADCRMLAINATREARPAVGSTAHQSLLAQQAKADRAAKRK